MYSIYCAGYQLRATVPCTLVTLYHVTSASERLSTSGDRGPCTGICHLKVQFLVQFLWLYCVGDAAHMYVGTVNTNS